MVYSPAGDGGPDGLRLFRHLITALPTLVDFTGAVLVIRCQSLGHAGGRLLLSEQLAETCRRHRWDAMVVTDQRVPVGVRAALTAQYAARLVPARGVTELLAASDAHLRASGFDSYVSSHLVLRSHGSGRLTHLDLTGSPPPESAWRAAGAHCTETVQARAALLLAFSHACQDLPDEFWELSGRDDLYLLLGRVDDVLDILAAPADVEDVVCALLGAASEPVRARALGLAVAVLLRALEAHGLVHRVC